MKKFVCVVFNGIDSVNAIQFESDKTQSVSPCQLNEELKEGDHTLVEATYAEYYCIWNTELQPGENLYLLDRELRKAATVMFIYDYDWLIQYLLEGLDYNPHHEAITKAFGSVEALRNYLALEKQECEKEIKAYEHYMQYGY